MTKQGKDFDLGAGIIALADITCNLLDTVIVTVFCKIKIDYI